MAGRINLSSLLSAGLLAIATSLAACNSTTETNPPISSATPTTKAAPTAAAKTEKLPLVVATNTVTCGLTKQIAGDTIELKCLIDPGSDPHVYQPKPDDRKAIEAAQLVLYGGYDFEPSLIKLIQATSSSAPKIAVDEIAVPNPQKFNEDGKTVPDPHVWHNAKNGIEIAKTISKNLTALRPDQSETYAQNTIKITNELEQIDSWIKAQIATIPVSSRKLVTTHDALGYYAKAYNLPLEGALSGISTDERPTPTRVKELVKVIKEANVPTIFAEVTINPKLIDAVAKEANVKVSERELFADGLGEKGSEGETYAGMLIANTRTIVEGLGGKYTPFQMK
ncbi:zinc ABC transporter substrate-binding protein [Tumidithrix elongata RA019]|uniref:Zinc ABC transporter substrate-binding protein n=1 Tax=Tumidithrix elongata BACA0141 TaxID=2716417 RepID=A0AAW9Q345_9CYAN|nr:zinc ABC transporter substrate-binding protein [Tumidithrix elongata RA019]